MLRRIGNCKRHLRKKGCVEISRPFFASKPLFQSPVAEAITDGRLVREEICAESIAVGSEAFRGAAVSENGIENGEKPGQVIVPCARHDLD